MLCRAFDQLLLGEWGRASLELGGQSCCEGPEEVSVCRSLLGDQSPLPPCPGHLLEAGDPGPWSMSRAIAGCLGRSWLANLTALSLSANLKVCYLAVVGRRPRQDGLS